MHCTWLCHSHAFFAAVTCPCTLRTMQQASFTSLHVTAKLPCNNMADCVLLPELLLCHGRNYVFIFYSFELKLCRMVELCIPKHPMFFCIWILTVFGGKMTSKDWQQNLNFKLWQNKEMILEELDVIKTNVKSPVGMSCSLNEPVKTFKNQLPVA